MEIQPESLEFLAGGGEMGARVRDHDWECTPLGPPDVWPQSLRTAAGIMLASRHPMFLAWGPTLTLLYNDAYAPMLGGGHPAALGRPLREALGAVWDDLWPLVDRALAGEATWCEDFHLVVMRHGFPEDAWYTFSYSPIRDETGGVGGMFCACIETTTKVREERRLEFLLDLGDRLRATDCPDRAASIAAEALGERLDAARVGFFEVEGERAMVDYDWTNGLVSSKQHEVLTLRRFGPELIAAFREGRTAVVADVAADPRTASYADAYLAYDIRSMIAVPLIRRRRLEAGLFVEAAAPREWLPWEVRLAEDVAERTWSAMEAARSAALLRASESRLRLIQQAGGVGSVDWDVVTGRTHRSPEFVQIHGLPPDLPLQGYYNDHWLQRVHPEDRRVVARWFREDCARGGPFEREYRIVRPDTGETRWIHNRGRIELGPDGRPLRLLSAQTDITARKREETRTRLLMNELNHRVKNTLATVQSIVAQTLRRAASPQAAQEDLENRLLALSRAHDILTRETWQGAGLAEVVEGAVEPYSGHGRVRILWQGPNARVSPSEALALAMALHELATNAAKYGALSVPGGKVEIEWSVEPEGTRRRLRLIWREHGGPPVPPHPRPGFGARLIEHGLARDLGGEVRLDFRPEGLVCTVDVLLSPQS